MTYQSEVLADSPLWYARLGESGVVNATTATASSAHAVGPASNAINGTVIGSWITNGVVAGWLRLQFGSAVTLTAYQVCGPETASGVNRAPKDWTFEGSNDGTTFTTLDTRTSQTSWASNETRAYTFSNSTAYLYYRINITANNGDASFSQIAELICGNPIADSSGNSRIGAFSMAGTTFGTTGLLSADSDKAATFDGTDDRIRFISYQSWMAPTAVTVEALIKTSTTTGTMSILDRDDQSPRASQFRLNAGKLEFVTSGGGAGTVTASDTTNIADGVRHHVAATYDATNIKLYVDGTLVKTQAASGALSTSQAKWSVGANFSGSETGAQFFNGVIDEVAVYGTALSAARISAHNTAATTIPTIHNGTASLTATCTLTADGFIGSITGSASANLTASSTLTGTAAVTRVVSATLTATSTLTSSANATLVQAIASLTATTTLTAAPEPPKSSAATASLYAASALFVDALTSTAATATLTATTTLTVAGSAFTPWVEPNDPRTGKPQYRLIVAHRDGTRYAEITDATTSPIEDGVGVGATFSFTMATADPNMSYIHPPATQAQVWRGTSLEFRGPMVKAADDRAGATTIDCRDPMWYLESGRRVMGAIPKRDLLVNGSFATGESPWAGGFEPDSIPAAQPARSVIDVDFFGTRMKALQISGVDKVVTVTKEVKTEAVFVPNSATYLPGGDSAIRAVANLMPKTGTLNVRVDGFTADNRINGDPGDGMALSKARADAAKATILGVRPNAVVTTVGYGYYQQIPGGQAANRRVVITWNGVQEASGHKQYEGQTLTVTQPVAKKAYLPLTAVIWVKITTWIGPSKDGRGLYLQIVNPAKPTVVVDSGTFEIDEKTPRDRWIRMEASLDKGVPADGIAYQAQVRLYPPAGTALFTRGGLYPGDQLAFFDVDQALIIKGLVEHAQDATIGKGALGIGTRCQATGLTRTRQYPYDERMEIDTAINEIAALYAGPEVVMEVTDTAQTVVTYHPRQGVATAEVLVHGGNVVSYEAPTDTRDAASSIILQADGSGADREEGYARDATALDGLLLERVISTENETPVTELEEGAVEALASFKRPQPAIWVTIDPTRTGDVLAKVRQGDTARLVIEPAGIDGTHRRVKRRLHLSDVLELMLTPEG